MAPRLPAGSPNVEPRPANIHDFSRLTAHDVAVVLDGVRDAVSGLTETIEVSQATVSAYQGAILEEKDNVRIIGQAQGGGRCDTSDIILLHSTSSEEVEGGGRCDTSDIMSFDATSSEEVEEVADNVANVAPGGASKLTTATKSRPRPRSSYRVAGSTSQLDKNHRPGLAIESRYRQSTGSTISLTSSPSDEELDGNIEPKGKHSSSESSSHSSVSPISEDEDGDSDSMVSSGGLTNTSEDEE